MQNVPINAARVPSFVQLQKKKPPHYRYDIIEFVYGYFKMYEFKLIAHDVKNEMQVCTTENIMKLENS